MKKAFLYVSACERRELDAKRIEKYLIRNNYLIVTHPKDADIIVFIACAVLDRPTKISLEKIKEFQKYDAELIVGGCLPAIEPEKLRAVFKGKTIPVEDLNNNPDKLDEIFRGIKIPFREIEDSNILFQNTDRSKPMETLKTILKNTRIHDFYYAFRYYVFKKIFGEHVILYRLLLKESSFQIRTSWGCTGKCSYCAINKAVGKLKSKTIEECIKEFKKGLKKGYKHFILTADNIGAYGLDIGTSFPELLDALTLIPGEHDITVLNLHPAWLVRYIDDIEKIVKRNKILNIDIPIQSGSNRILRLMNRYSNIEKIKEACLRLKKANTRLILGTDCIIGFPTETLDELRKTLDLLVEIGFHVGTAIKYSQKTGTKAEEIKPALTKKEINKRFKFAKKYLRKKGFSIIHTPHLHYFVFSQKNK